MMRRLLSILSLGAVTANMPIYGNPNSAAHSRELKIDSIKADSTLGTKLLSQARRLDDNGADMSWVVDYSIKFQGCHHVSQWNDYADQDDQVRIQTKRLIRFRLCPTDTCSTSGSTGCSSGYGDYIIDMNSFLEVYFQAVEEQNQSTCQNAYGNCNCQDNGADDYNEEMCYYDCYYAQGVADICMDNNPYADNGQDQEKFQLQDYADCRQTNFNNRRLEDAGNDEDNAEQEDAEQQDNEQDNEEQQQQQQQQENQNQYYEQNAPEYYVGPYCAEQGGSIYLGLFYDETCTTFADNKGGSYTFKTLTGQELPYASKTIITSDCLSCQDNNNNDNNNNNGVSEVCGQVYQEAGKCEKQLYSAGVVDYPNENACNYIKGIKVVRKDGIITQVGSKADKTASIFIGIFVVAFVLLAAYVYYLKTKLDRVSINLAEQYLPSERLKIANTPSSILFRELKLHPEVFAILFAKMSGVNVVGSSLKYRNILVVIKQTAFEEYSQLKLRGQAPKALRWKRLEQRYKAHKKCVNDLLGVLRKQEISFSCVNRVELDRQHLADIDLMVAVGGDGTALSAAHFLDHGTIPLLGVNSDPNVSLEDTKTTKKVDERRSHGALCMCTAMDLDESLPRVLFGEAEDELTSRTRIRCKVKSTFSETRLVPALNDLLIANPSPAAVSRFRMGYLEEQDPDKPKKQLYGTVTRFAGIPYDVTRSLNVWSSGMWVCTSTGSSAAMAAAGGKKMEYDSTDLQYLIREHMMENANEEVNADVNNVMLKDGEKLHLRWNSQRGRIFIDGSHLTHNLELGDEILIDNNAPPLQMFIPKTRKKTAT